MTGDSHTVAFVGHNGLIDWLCLPRFYSGAYFAALLACAGHGRWLIAPREGACSVRRAAHDGTLILETGFGTAGGAVRLMGSAGASLGHWSERPLTAAQTPCARPYSRRERRAARVQP